MLYLHVCPVVLDAVEDDFTDLTAEVKHWVQHARGCLTIVLLELLHHFGMPEPSIEFFRKNNIFSL